MSKDKFHFEIPKDNIRNEKYEKTGGGVSVERSNHKEHGLVLLTEVNELKEIEYDKRDFHYTSDIYLQIETPRGYSLKNQKQKIEHLGLEILSYSTTNKSLGTARIKKDKIEIFEEKLNEYINSQDNTGKTYFSPIEHIYTIPSENKIKSEIDVTSLTEVSIIINLFNALEKKERLAINNRIVEEIKQYTENVSFQNFTNGISSIECTIKGVFISKIASEFTTIREIKVNRTFFVENSIPAEKVPSELKVMPVQSNSTICIIDSGINRNGIFKNIVQGQILYLPAGSIDCGYNHGTFVASRCVFGDNIENCLGTYILEPYCYLLDVPVFGIDNQGKEKNPTEFELRKAIEEVVLANYKHIKVFNLSLGIPNPIANFEFSELAKLLDFLSKEYKVLFVIAAGNINRMLGPFPVDHFNHFESRIGSPAESLLGLTVGSIAKYSNPNSLSQNNFLSAFSRIGPGADMGIKPEVVAHGGNLILPYTPSPRTSTYGISSDGLNLALDVGTSHAAPIISQYAQKLFDYYPNSDPNLVKSLICHFSDKRDKHNQLTDANSKYVGFGEPNIENAIRANDHNAAFIFEGELDQENYQYISFHVPKTLACEEDSKLKIKITITYDPSVNPDNEYEYSNSRISAKLFKPSTRGFSPINISRDKYNLPWNPIIQFEKSFTRAYLTGLWDLRLRLYTRGNVDENYKQDYSVVIEIIDEKSNKNVYEDIISEFGKIYKQIEINIAA
ncbi:S8 family peptidase [Flavobacterium sp.]|uniref:S8 family peptidase n=1 Tax=Flavobacterium sp. TaxID=239 RepID=UPI0031D23062